MFMFGVKVRGAESNPGNLNGVQGSNCFPRQDNILHFRCMENFSLSDFLPQQITQIEPESASKLK